MNVIAKRTLRDYWEKYPDAEAALKEWHRITNKATWEKASDIIDNISNSRFIGNDRFVFKIRGNRYRLIVKVVFPYKQVYIRTFGTHSAYDIIVAKTI